MKIYNTSCFEKLKIRPVDVSKISTYDFIRCEVDPNKIKLRDLEVGYICKTNEIRTESFSNIWVCVNENMMNLLMPELHPFKCGGLITPSKECYMSLEYLLEDEYSETWPLHEGYDCYNILEVWKTNDFFFEQLNSVSTVAEFIDFYNKYNLNSL